MNKEELEQLVLRAQQDDEEAFVKLYQYYYRHVYGAAYKLCHNDADAQEATQLAFIQMHRSIHSLKHPSYFPLWINQVVLNKCKNLFRSHREVLFDDAYFAIANQFVEHRQEANAQANAHFQSDQELLYQMIQQLSKEQQDVLRLTYFKQMNNEEVAIALNLPIGTVKSRLSAARHNLKKKVAYYEEKEKVSLDFKENSILGAFVYYILKMHTSITTSFIPIQTQYRNKHYTNKNIVKAGIILSCATLGIVGGVVLHHESKQRSQIKMSEETLKSSAFPKLDILDYNIESSQDAYYFLRGWSYDEKAMQKKDSQQIRDVVPLYQALKEKDDVFYQLLKDCGWSTNFEKIANL